MDKKNILLVDDGFVLSYHISQDYPGVPVIMVTGVTAETDKIRAVAIRDKTAHMKEVSSMDPLKIHIVDDEPGMRMAAARALRDFQVPIPESRASLAVEVEQFETAEKALELLEENPPDIMLLDHKLPGMSGLDLLERLGADRCRETIVIMITAYASIETAITATKRGAYDFLVKPFTPDELKYAVRNAATHLLLRRQARRLAEEKRRVRFEFIRVLGHELKAPLNAVEGHMMILKDQVLGEIPSQYLELIDRSILRIDGMRKLIMDLLGMTRIESGERERTLRELDLVTIAQDALETVQADAEARGVSLNLHADAPVMLRADRTEIDMVLNNLLTNAVKYNRDKGRVDITIGNDANGISLIVADTGIGMSGKDIGKTFDEFTRIKNAKTRAILESGLGLSILRKLVDLYESTIDVQSEPDKGTTFHITLKRSA